MALLLSNQNSLRFLGIGGGSVLQPNQNFVQNFQRHFRILESSPQQIIPKPFLRSLDTLILSEPTHFDPSAISWSSITNISKLQRLHLYGETVDEDTPNIFRRIQTQSSTGCHLRELVLKNACRTSDLNAFLLELRPQLKTLYFAQGDDEGYPSREALWKQKPTLRRLWLHCSASSNPSEDPASDQDLIREWSWSDISDFASTLDELCVDIAAVTPDGTNISDQVSYTMLADRRRGQPPSFD